MRVAVDRNNGTAVYLQIFEQIRQQILAGELAPGFHLPPERKLAEALGVNRSTVLNAYRELKAEGLVGSQVGHGTVVLAPLPIKTAPSALAPEPEWDQLFNRYSTGYDSHIVQDLLKLASRNDVISFATGIADPVISPIEALAGIEEEIVQGRNFKALLHSPTEGFLSLRTAIAGLMQQRGVFCRSDQIMVLAGSQQGIDLAARLLLDPDDIVVVEDPTFFPAVQAFKAAGARVMSIPMDAEGMRTDLLDQLLQRYRVKLMYTMPNFHNPTGVEMTLGRRQALLELAYKYKVPILEDDAYGDLRYDGPPLPSLKAMDRGNHVVYLSTFSKTVYSGLRLGWLVAPKAVVKKFAAAKQIMDLHSSSLSQWIIERFITNGGLERHVDKICREYKRKRHAMCEALERYGPTGLIWQLPRGGYYLWCRLPEGVSAGKLLDKAARRKVAFLPGTPFFSRGQGDEYIRLNYTFVPLAEISAGVEQLCAALQELIEETDYTDGETVLDINPIV